jgi:hypothetical protein
MAFVSGNGSSSLANSSQVSFVLSSLVFVTEEQMESLEKDELALIISRFLWFHNNHLNHRRGGGPKEGCYGCGDPDHFVARCPKKNKHSFDKYDSSKRKDKHEYTSKHKLKGEFDKEALKKKYFKKRPKSVPSSPLSATLTTTPTTIGLLFPRAMMSPRRGVRTS